MIGGGLVGVELIGELTAFADDVLRFYPRIRREEICFRLFEAGARILPEIDAALAGSAARVLERRGVDIRVATPVRSIEADRVRLERETIDAGTIVLTAGIVPSVAASAVPVARDQRGRIAVDATMRSRSHPHVWALGDCASIPGPDGRPYPALAQHAIREAQHLARNIRDVLDGRAPAPFIFRSLGTMASLGHTRAVARVFGMRLTGFPAWWLRRTYYLFQMPRWERRLRIVLDWTVALFFRPDTTRVDLRVEREQVVQARQLVERPSETVPGMRTPDVRSDRSRPCHCTGALTASSCTARVERGGTGCPKRNRSLCFGPACWSAVKAEVFGSNRFRGATSGADLRPRAGRIIAPWSRH